MTGCYAAGFLKPDTYWYISILSLGYYFWLGLNIAFIVIWLFIKWKYMLGSFIVVALGFTFHSKMIAVNIKRSGERPIRVMSYNVQLFKFYDWKKNEMQRDKILMFIDDNRADILCFQEYFQTKDNEFTTTEKLKNILPEHKVHFEAGVVKNSTQQYGVATFTKYPIINKGLITIDSTRDRTNLVIYTDMLIEHDTVRVYNVHLASNHLNTNEVDSMASEKSIFFVKKWMKKLKNGYNRRFNQVHILMSHLKKCRYPCIIAGDFNDVPLSYTYRMLTSDYKDAFIESGSGIGTTYNGNLPMLRIDYIFYSPHFGSTKFMIPEMKITDHYPIQSDLFLKKKK